MTPHRKSRLPIAVMISVYVLSFLTLALAACGGGDDNSKSDGSPAASGPSTVTVTSSGIAGQSGKSLVIFVSSGSGGPVARACLSITSDKFEVPATVLTDMPSQGQPCGESTPKTVFPDGTYTLSAGIYVPPATQPEKQTQATVQVSGAAQQVKIDGGALSK